MNASKAVGVIVLMVVLSLSAYIGLTGEPRLALSIANGSYANRCCGRVVLTNGIMAVANQRIGYVVEQDKEGPYVLPNAYVGASDTGLVIRPNGFPLKLRLDDQSYPRSVDLLDDRPGGKSYSFERTAGHYPPTSGRSLRS